MKTSNIQSLTDSSESVRNRLLIECKSMIKYAIKKGKSLKATQVELLTSGLNTGMSNVQLVNLYNYLTTVVSPAQPNAITLLESDEGTNNLISFLGPLPIFRQFMLTTVLSIIALIGISMSPALNTHTIQMSILQGSGVTQIVLLAFLISSASLGACFHALFKMNSFISDSTFDPTFNFSYWSRYCLGIVAGLLLSEFFVSFVDQTSEQTNSANDGPIGTLSYLLKPVLAMIGGLSANLVYRIFNQLVNAIEGVFKLDTKEIIAQKSFEFQLKSRQEIDQIRNESAQSLLTLKQKLVNQNLPSDVMDHFDNVLSGVISGNDALQGKTTEPIK